MTLRACPREKEVSALVLRGQWQGVCADELRAHVESCRACGDLVQVMQAFQAARAASAGAASPGSAGALWWRAQLRRRKAAVEQIGRPILGAQIFALSITIAIAAIFAVSQARQGQQWLKWIRQLGQSPTFHLGDLWSSAATMPQWGLLLLIFGIAAVAVLSGVVLFSDRRQQ
jgi:hypothetical protein